ncbi:MAG: hypothetical protein ACI4SF_13290 [Oscillospiraceae bacterium]
MKKYIFALSAEKTEKLLYRTDEAELETRFPILLPLKATAEQDELVNITLIISENSPGTSANFLSLMMELKALAEEVGFKYDLTEIRIAGEENPDKQKRVFEALIETLSNGDSIFADITFGHKAVPLIIFTAMSFCYKLRQNTEIRSVIYADQSSGVPTIHDISTLFYMESVIHSVSQSVPDDPLPIIKRILNM